MIHPSYVELMDVINNGAEEGEEPVVNSRYSVVCATAKRARQLIDGAEPLIDPEPGEKPLSIAVKELYSGKLTILNEEEEKDSAAKIAEVADKHFSVDDFTDGDPMSAVEKMHKKEAEAAAAAEAASDESSDAE